VVRIGALAGQVERITLRMTVLRDLDGTVHFVPNGTITAVSNMTHEYSRAVFDVSVGYREDIDRAVDVLRGLAADLRKDPLFGHLMLEDMEMWGVEMITDSAAVIRFRIKTRPLHQWTVKRELQRRILRRFAELGIEIAHPQRIIHHRDLPARLPPRLDLAAADAAAAYNGGPSAR
jgi:small conductance mechanosensitive channel